MRWRWKAAYGLMSHQSLSKPTDCLVRRLSLKDARAHARSWTPRQRHQQRSVFLKKLYLLKRPSQHQARTCRSPYPSNSVQGPVPPGLTIPGWWETEKSKVEITETQKKQTTIDSGDDREYCSPDFVFYPPFMPQAKWEGKRTFLLGYKEKNKSSKH